MALCILGVSHHARAAEDVWTCSFNLHEASSQKPTLISFRVNGQQMVESRGTGKKIPFRVLLDNSYGLIGIVFSAEIEPNNSNPTVGAQMMVLDKTTKQFWLAQAANNVLNDANKVVKGTCIHQ
jgi:hypothetical protein